MSRARDETSAKHAALVTSDNAETSSDRLALLLSSFSLRSLDSLRNEVSSIGLSQLALNMTNFTLTKAVPFQPCNRTIWVFLHR